MQMTIKAKLDTTGRVTIPKFFRDELWMEENEPLEVKLTPGGVFIRSEKPKCMFCGEATKNEYKGRPVCIDCIRNMYAEKSL